MLQSSGLVAFSILVSAQGFLVFGFRTKDLGPGLDNMNWAQFVYS